MSDERDSADAAGDGNDTEGGGRTAVVTRPQRPSGKRSRQRVDADTEPAEAPTEAVDVVEDGVETKPTKRKRGGKSKKRKRAKKSAAPSVNPIVFVYTYLKQVVAELRKVIWPNPKQMISYTSVVLAFLTFMVALIGVVDLGLAKLVLLVFG